ncbi:MAG TPA: putative Na+/H+ antiporter [Chthoniobacterales bacterium]|nr:putative Na+/H+ antiporter [Chthoniobacterales bacterium]
MPATFLSLPRRSGRVFRAVILLALFAAGILALSASAAETPAAKAEAFPRPLTEYGDAQVTGIGEVLRNRAAAEPFNVVATLIFLLAIIHTFLAPRFMKIAHRWRDEHEAALRERADADETSSQEGAKGKVSLRAETMHFFGEIEAVFGIWVLPLLLAITFWHGWPAAENYISRSVNFTEPMFVVVVMTIASTRPVLRFAEWFLSLAAGIGGRNAASWWLSILTIGPILGSFITEPAAMTICALLLASRFYDLQPSIKFRYATLGLLFVNISVGGTLTHFAAPPVLMVATRWSWDSSFMFTHFGWKAVLGILLANAVYFAAFRREFQQLRFPAPENGQPENWSDRTDPVPVGVTIVHLFFLAWTVFTAHYPSLFIGGFLFFLAFTTATEHHQNPISLKPALLVGFFLAGLVIHGGFQGWWIAPVLGSMTEIPLIFGAMTLTAFNDNAAITYLATLVPDFSDSLKYAVVAGAVAGGGLTVIANAPNPAGQSILGCYFGDGISALWLLVGALIPTAIMMAVFLFLP